jgi:putative cell wall-binding protein
MLRRHVRRVAVLAGAVSLVAVPAAWSVPAQAEGGAPALPVLSYVNASLAYSCFGHLGAASVDGWSTVAPLGTGWAAPAFVHWTAGTFGSGVQWSADGSEMVHVAAVVPTGPPVVVVSEGNGTFPWQDTNLAQAGGWTDSQATFTDDGTQVLFTRHQGTSTRIEQVPAAGVNPLEIPQPVGANSEPDAAPAGDIVFVNVAPTGPQAGQQVVWILRAGTTSAEPLIAGSLPRFNSDGTKIAFLAPASNRIRTMNLDGTGAVTVGPVVADPIDDFRWSPDKTQFVIASGGSVLTAPTTNGSSATAVGGSECGEGVAEVAWQQQPASTTKDKVFRVYGLSREETAIAISQTSFPATDSAGAVVLANSLQFPDGLSAAPLAAKEHGPLLLTVGTATTPLPEVVTEIGRVLPAGGKVYIVGGTGSISQGIQNALTNLHYVVQRIAGADRYATSLAVANELGTGANAPRQLLLATGTDYPDGLSAGAAAASYWVGTGPQGGAVLLTNGAALTPGIRAYIQADIAAHPDPAAKVTVTTVGGLADKAYPAVGRISCAGADRYATSACVARTHFGAQPFLTVAAGNDFPDSLAGGVFAGAINAPLLLVPAPLTTTSTVPYWLQVTSAATHVAYAFGGPGALGGPVNQLRAIIGLDTGYAAITYP